MPHKIGFCVLHASGADTGVSMHELEVHSPLARGWQSARFCLYPQEIIIQLAEKTRIKKLQLLAHQYLIRKCAMPKELKTKSILALNTDFEFQYKVQPMF